MGTGRTDAGARGDTMQRGNNTSVETLKKLGETC